MPATLDIPQTRKDFGSLSLELTQKLKAEIDRRFGGLFQLENINRYEDFISGRVDTLKFGDFKIQRKFPLFDGEFEKVEIIKKERNEKYILIARISQIKFFTYH